MTYIDFGGVRAFRFEVGRMSQEMKGQISGVVGVAHSDSGSKSKVQQPINSDKDTDILISSYDSSLLMK